MIYLKFHPHDFGVNFTLDHFVQWNLFREKVSKLVLMDSRTTLPSYFP